MSYELVYASKFPEFFYKADQGVVSEHTPVGVDITIEHKGSPSEPPSTEVQFKLFDNIYWSPDFTVLDNE